MMAFTKILRSQKGQGLIELGLALPLLLLLALGAVEVSNMINSWLVLTHLTREGANMTSRGTPADVGGKNYGNPSSPDYDALDAMVDSSAPVITPGNQAQWRIIYSSIGPTNPGGCAANPLPSNPDCSYVVVQQIPRGGLEPVDTGIECPATGSKIACAGFPAEPTDMYVSIGAGKTIFAIEAYYQYQTITPLANFGITIPGTFYEWAIF